jgi:hypothetical protein
MQPMVLQDAVDIVNECLDNLAEVMGRFGSLVPQCRADLLEKVLPLLDDNRAPIRKRAMHCVCKLPDQRNSSASSFPHEAMTGLALAS